MIEFQSGSEIAATEIRNSDVGKRGWYVWLTMMPARQDHRNARARGTQKYTTAGRERQGFANAKTDYKHQSNNFWAFGQT